MLFFSTLHSHNRSRIHSLTLGIQRPAWILTIKSLFFSLLLLPLLPFLLPLLVLLLITITITIIIISQTTRVLHNIPDSLTSNPPPPQPCSFEKSPPKTPATQTPPARNPPATSASPNAARSPRKTCGRGRRTRTRRRRSREGS